ncbi:SufS family cysteine desulfurase [Thalassotalea euphylliae]|uniref:cysteine desulfurase n=1 Tax=Thalassotalea euphylliae TaxID=1655234 RepID=A0A3E0TIZ6_9GAMM|nr:SufS family cysteine desulfurase [Thalassotalea euphylliae]REL24423.1 SufS family cysteine desulfurase [Thalassotalea euphylliae]
MAEFSPKQFRKQFPLFSSTPLNSSMIYFDNAATTQKPLAVIDEIAYYYQTSNANVHRSSHQLSASATAKFEKARLVVKQFIGAKNDKEIVWTKGTTEAINIVAQCYARPLLTKHDEIVVSYAEHHANIVPWQQVAEHTGAKLNVLPLTSCGRIDLSSLDSVINSNTKLIAINMISNVTGKRNAIERIIAKAKAVGAKVLIDGAQAIAHERIDVHQLDCDFFAFSAHKVFGPTGAGVLYGKEQLLTAMPPYQFGGEMIKKVSFNGTSFADLPFKFETGTPNIAGVLGLAKALAFTKQYQASMAIYEQQLIDYTHSQLKTIPQIKFLFDEKPDIPIFSFVIEGEHNQDVAAYLDTRNIAIRAGHHCAMPLMEYLGQTGCLRVSLAPYNLISEVDSLIVALKGYLAAGAGHTSVQMNVSTEQAAPLNNPFDKIAEQFARAKGWDGRHREIMLLSKQLERLPKDERNSDFLVQGCESDVWLKANKDASGIWQFQADCDAKVIRGLLVIVLAIFNHQHSEKIATIDVESYFDELGLIQHLSPSRGNGLRAIVERIKRLVSEN